MTGLKRGTVRLEPHDPKWAELFEDEKQLFNNAFGDMIIAIEHIGSTSISGIPAKPIIDMNIGVSSLDVARAMKDGFERLGYEHRPVVPGHSAEGLESQELYVKGPESRRTHYAHVTVYGSDYWTNDLQFRDYLRKNVDRAQEYADLKARLAHQYADNRRAYTNGKAPFIARTLEVAGDATVSPNINRANIESCDCSVDLKQGIGRYVAQLAGLLGGDLLGVYLYGSLARGCYNAATSDVDVIVVVRENCSGVDESGVLEVHRNSAILIDAVFVTEDQMHLDAFPSPLMFLVKKPMDDCTIVHVPEGRRDFLLQRQDAFEAGVWLVGPAVADLPRPVPWPLIAESLDYVYRHIVTHFKNPVLMLCRVVYAWTHRELCSKKRAGEWARTALDARWASTLETALAEYATGCAKSSIPADEIQAFEDYCAGCVSDLRAH